MKHKQMKRVWFLLSVCLLTVGSLSARQLSPTEALEKAKQYLSQPNIGKIGTAVRLGTLSSRQSAASQAKSPEAAPQLVYTGARGSLNTVYVFNDNGGGFLIVSADDVATPLLGYSDTGSFDAGAIPPAMQYWLDCYSDEIEQSVSAGTVGRAGVAYAAAEARADIAPLIHTKWNQGSPYNDLCPTIAGKRCVTGCVATAMAQIMKYYNYPQHGTGSHSYTQEDIEGAISADFGATTYDWNAMLDEYDADSPAASRKAVATLMYHAGVSVDMQYNPGASGAFPSDVAESLVKYFNYDKKIKYLLRDDYALSEWKNIVYEELSASRPVLYSGRGSSGHVFVCDGYQYRDGEDYFHINWGWSGAYDGYFLLTALDPDGQGAGYNSDQGLIVGIQPAFFPPTDITPAAGKVAALKTITLAFERMPYLVGKAVMVTKGEESYPAAIAAGSSNTLVITLAEELSAAGTYVLTIPAGTFGDANYAADQKMGYCNRVLSYTYTINADEPARKTTFNPTNIASVTKVSALKSVTLAFAETPYPVGTTAMLTKGGENCPATIAAGSGNTLVVTPDIETPAAGTYVLTIPEGAFGDAAYAADQTSGRCNPALSYTIVVDPSFTPTSISPAEGQIFSLRTFTLDFDYTEAPRLVNSVATVTKGEESYPATITAGRGNTLVITLAEELTAAGVYALTIPAGTFGDADYAADRTSGCCNTELVYTYTITPVYYRITSDSDLTAEVISGEKKYTGDIVIPETVEQDGNVYRITAIGNSAFFGCRGLSSVTIPKSVATIGFQAFSCTGLQSLTIPQSVIAIGSGVFSGCSGLKKFEGKFASADNRCLIVNDTLVAFAPNALTQYTISADIKVIGESAFSDCNSLKSITIPESVTAIGDQAFFWCTGLTSITIHEGVTSIGDLAFYCCSGLESVTIPKSVTYIGDYAFSGCSGLEEVWFNADSCTSMRSVFSGCTSSTTIHIGENVKYIPDYAFYYCPGLTSITIPESVTTIGKSAFAYCENLTSVTIPKSITTISDYAFFACRGLLSVTIPKSVATIGFQAFSCTGLQSLTIPESVTYIDYAAFFKCTELKEVWFNADSCTSMTKYVFEDCTSLTTIHIGENVKLIPDWAFTSCTGLTSIIIPDGVTTIGAWAFASTGLTSITIPESVTTIGVHAFEDCTGLTDVYFNADSCTMDVVFGGCTSLTTVHIGENVKSIPDGAFYRCSGLKSVTIGRSVTTIGLQAFYGCTSLKEVWFNADSCTYMSFVFSDCTSLTTIHIGENVKWIPVGAFSGCTGLMEFEGKWTSSDHRCLIVNDTLVAFAPNALTEYTISADIKAIGDGAFSDCSSLKSVTIPNSVISIGDYAFEDCEGLTSVTIGENVAIIADDAFNRCRNLKEVWFNADSCISGGFSGCEALKTVYIGENVKSIPRWAFYDCTGLTEVYFNADSCTYMRSVFVGCTSLTTVHIGENVKFIPGRAFEDCGGLEEITIPNSVATIGDYAFYGCSGLKSITIPESITSIGDLAFYGCESLKEVWFNADSCISGGFGWCPLETVHIGENVKRIPNNAFSSCRNLTSVTIPESVITIGDGAFSECEKLKEVWFNADSCISGGFSNCSALTTIHIGENVKSIPSWAFFDCDGLTSVTIPDSVTTISDLAFSWCDGLTSVTIPNSVTAIGERAFYGCSNLQSVTAYNPTPVNIVYNGISVFDGVDYETCKLYVPAGSVDAYKAADGWKKFFVLSMGGAEPDVPDVPDTPSSVTEAQADAEHLTVYTLQGVPVLETNDAAALRTLPAGAYIVNGKKMIITR